MRHINKVSWIKYWLMHLFPHTNFACWTRRRTGSFLQTQHWKLLCHGSKILLSITIMLMMKAYFCGGQHLGRDAAFLCFCDLSGTETSQERWKYFWILQKRLNAPQAFNSSPNCSSFRGRLFLWWCNSYLIPTWPDSDAWTQSSTAPASDCTCTVKTVIHQSLWLHCCAQVTIVYKMFQSLFIVTAYSDTK